MSARQAKTGPWDRYWAYGNVHSFSQVAAGNYQGAIADFWRARFEKLDEGSRILDIATGNGAIALLALETGDRLSRCLDVHGVDLAAIEPGKQVKDPSLAESLARIRFHGRTGAENLPFESESLDMVCSQFGLEYSDMSRSVPELARVLKPGGRFAAILHHQDSRLLQATREELAQLDFVLNDVKLYLRARGALRAIIDEQRGRKGRDARPGPRLQKKQRALQNAMDQVRQAAERSANPNMLRGPARYIQEIFGALERVPPGELLGWLDEAQDRVTANQRRLLDMRQAALHKADCDELYNRLSTSGLVDIALAPLRQDQAGILGWQVDALKSPAGGRN